MPRVISLDKSLTVLEAVFRHREGIGTRALAGELRLNVATVHNIARTFCNRGYLRQDPKTKVFLPGIRLMLLGRHPFYIHSLSLSASPIVDEVAQRLNETVLLASIDHGRVLNLKYITSRQALRVMETENTNEYIYCTAVGKILLNAMTDTELENCLNEIRFQKLTPHTITNIPTLRQELAKVKKLGYSETHDEFFEGVSALAVPIHDPWGGIIAALGASAPTIRMDKGPYKRGMLEALREAANQIELQWKNAHLEPHPKQASSKK